MSKLIVVACGAGINTSTIAEDSIRERIAKETAELYAPIANRLGIGRIRAELEDLAFQYLEPEAHRALTEASLSVRARSKRSVFALSLISLNRNDSAARDRYSATGL